MRINGYQGLRELNYIQQCAQVDRDVRELTAVFAKLKLDAGQKAEEIFQHQPAQSTIYTRWIRKLNPEIDERVEAFLIRYANTLAAKKTAVIFSCDHLAAKLRMSPKQLNWISHHQQEFYREFRIPKSRGRFRSISSPTDKLRTVQNWILRHILDGKKPSRYATAFVKGRSIIDNAAKHQKRNVVIRLDIQDFFPSVTYQQVRKVFQHLGYPYRVSCLLANLCTLKGSLPQGAPTSPALANLVCSKLDRRLGKLAWKSGMRYSRYADDIILSSNRKNAPQLIPFIAEIIKDEGFELNKKKTRIMRPGNRQLVTGIVVNQTMNLPRKEKRRIRAALHRAQKQGIQGVTLESNRHRHVDGAGNPERTEAVLRGKLNHWNMVNPKTAPKVRGS